MFSTQFATLLLTILIIQVAVAIYAFVVLKNADEINFNKEYTKVFSHYKEDSQKEFVDLIQQEVRWSFEIIIFFAYKTMYYVALFEFSLLAVVE